MTLSALAIFSVANFMNSRFAGPSVAALVARVSDRRLAQCAAVSRRHVARRNHLADLRGVRPQRTWRRLSIGPLSFSNIWVWPICFISLTGCGRRAFDEKEAVLPKGESSMAAVFYRLAITLGNPKIMVFYLAFLPSIIDLAR